MEAFREAFARTRSRRPCRRRPGCAARRSTRSSAARASATRSPSSSTAWPVRDRQPRGHGCWSRARRSPTCGRWGRASATRASACEAARRRALGVAFGVNGGLARRRALGPVRRLAAARAQRVERRGRAAGRARRALPGARRRPTPSDGLDPDEAIAEAEFWRRHDAERGVDLAAWPPPPARAGQRARGGRPARRLRGRGAGRPRLERRAGAGAVRGCGPPARAGRARGPPGALRRRRAGDRLRRGSPTAPPRPARPGCEPRARRGARRLGGAGPRPGAGRPLRARSCVIDPPPFAHLERLLARRARGFLHRLDGPPEARVRAPGPRRGVALARLARAHLPRARGALATGGRDRGAAGARRARGRRRSHPLSPEVGGRASRVLAELGLRALGAIRRMLARSASYPRRGRIWSDPRPSSPTASATRRAGDS